MVFFTVRLVKEGPCRGRIHVRTDVTMGQMKVAYNKYLEGKDKEVAAGRGGGVNGDKN